MKNFEVILTASELSHILPKCPELRYHRTDEIHQRHFCLSSLYEKKRGKTSQTFRFNFLKQFGHLCRKMTPIKFACNYSYSGGFSDKNSFQILFFLCPRKNIWLIKQTANTHLIKFLPKVSKGFRAAFAPKTFCRGFQMFLPNIAVTPTVNTVINALSD